MFVQVSESLMKNYKFTKNDFLKNKFLYEFK